MNLYVVNFHKPVHSVDSRNTTCAVDGLRSAGHVNISKSVHPVDALKLARSVNFNKIVCAVVNYNKPGCPVNSSTIVRPVNSSNFVHPANIHTLILINLCVLLILVRLCVLLMFVTLYAL